MAGALAATSSAVSAFVLSTFDWTSPIDGFGRFQYYSVFHWSSPIDGFRILPIMAVSAF